MRTEDTSQRYREDPEKSRELRMQTARDLPEDGATFLDIVTFEQRRAERYRHYLVVAVLTPRKVGIGDLVRIASRSVRASDLVGAVSPDGSFRWDCNRSGRDPRDHEPEQARAFMSGSLGLVFPETDRTGAEAAIARIVEKVGVDGAVSVRCAVYPDDSTDPRRLVAITAA